MVTVTDRAAAELQELLRAQNASETQGVKLSPGGDGRIEMSIDEPADGDEVTHHEGRPVLIVDSRIVDALEGAEVDFESETVDGVSPIGFTLRPTSAG